LTELLAQPTSSHSIERAALASESCGNDVVGFGVRQHRRQGLAIDLAQRVSRNLIDDLQRSSDGRM
jgi:hypothetical protein